MQQGSLSETSQSNMRKSIKNSIFAKPTFNFLPIAIKNGKNVQSNQSNGSGKNGQINILNSQMQDL